MTNPRKKSEGKLDPRRLQHLFLQHLRKERIYSKWMRNVRELNAQSGWRVIQFYCNHTTKLNRETCETIKYAGFGWSNSPEDFTFWWDKMKNFTRVLNREFKKEKYHG